MTFIREHARDFIKRIRVWRILAQRHQEYRVIFTDPVIHPFLKRRFFRCYEVVVADDVVDFQPAWKLPGLLYAENSLFSMRRFVALLESGELFLRAGDVRLVRTAELKELPLATKIQLSGIELGLAIFRSRFLSGGARLGNCRGRRVYFWLTRLASQKTRFQRCQLLLRRNHLRLCQLRLQPND